MKNNFFGEIIISLLLIGVLISLSDPMYLLMPKGMYPLITPLLLALLIIFAGILWKERPGDEREHLHKFMASRSAYFAGIVVLIIAIALQSIHREIDIWLIITVCIMLLAKIAGIIYGHIKY